SLISGTTHAADKVGNGGNGLLIEGKAYVLDLVEAGVEKAPYFNESAATDPRLLAQLQKYLPQFPDITPRLAAKLSEIEAISPVTAWLLAESFRLYSFRVVDEALVNINDDDTVVDYPAASLVQLAVRRSKVVFLNGKWWPSLDIDQKTALLMHEMVYAYQLNSENARDNDELPRQSSVLARALVGFLFTSDIRDRGYDGLLLAMHSGSRLYTAANWIRTGIAGAKTSALETELLPNTVTLYRVSDWSYDEDGNAIGPKAGAEVNHRVEITKDVSKKEQLRLCNEKWDVQPTGYLTRAVVSFAPNPANGLAVALQMKQLAAGAALGYTSAEACYMYMKWPLQDVLGK
ncbi:MAG: hypothetical protein ACXWQO_15430, partial [Bdellovibrionota bacterium]